MPSGTVHTGVNLGVLSMVAIAGINGMWWEEVGVWWFVGTYLFSTFLLSPDLDLKRNQSRKSWGLLGFAWAPYARVFKHRGVSHHWVWGPLTRVAYLALMALPVFVLRPAWLPWVTSVMQTQAIPIVLGLYAPHWLHIYLDAALSRR